MYDIITDSTADLTVEQINRFNLKVTSFSYMIGEDNFSGFKNGKYSDLKSFYDRMRNGEPSGTAQLSRHDIAEIFESSLKEGKDVLYIGFSSGLSGTMNSSVIVAEELSKKYPHNKVYAVDSLAASMGQGLIVYHAAELKEQGKTIDEVKKWVEENRLRLCHWFTVDDLKYLKRGGRISPTTAFVGTLMGIKPILHVDDAGHLVPISKIRGRLHSIEEIFRHMKETVEDPENQVIFIGHGDCPDDADYLERLVRKEWKVRDVVTNYIDATIGAHSGPGTLAIFYLGSKR